MLQRRHQVASLVSLFVVTLLFVWACSSGDHEDAWVTTSGGAGSAVSTGSVTAAQGDAGSVLGFGGTRGSGSPASVAAGGSVDASLADDLDPPTTGASPGSVSAGGAAGGSGGVNNAGASSDPGGGAASSDPGGGAASSDPGGGAPSGDPGGGAPSAGGAAAGGTPAVSEPVCDPADDHSTPDMLLPCEVSTAFYVCRNCHTNPPV